MHRTSFVLNMPITKSIFLYYFLIGLFLMSASIPLRAQIKQIEKPPTGRLEVVSRQTLNKDNPLFYRINGTTEMLRTPIKITGDTKVVKVLRDGIYAKKVDRIISFDDGADHEIPTDIFLSIYNGSGRLIKSIGRIGNQPAVAKVSENGSIVIATDKSKPGEKMPAFYLLKYNKDGGKEWEKKTALTPRRIFISKDEKYIALVSYDEKISQGSIQYYDASGTLLFIDNNHKYTPAVEFLGNEKVIVCTAGSWYLYDISKHYQLVFSDSFKGIPACEYPVSLHPTKNIFTIVTYMDSGLRVYAYSSSEGTLIGETVIQDEPFKSLSRLIEFTTNGNIQLLTSEKIITLHIKP